MSVRNLFRRGRGRAGPVAVVAVLGVVALLAAGCGGSDSDSPGVATASKGGDQAGATTTTAAKANEEQQLLQFTKCMREHGVNMADPTVDANGNLRLQPPTGSDQPSQAEMQKARDACEQYLQGVTQGFTGQNQTESRDALLKYAQCMRKNGYDMPDPDFSDSANPFGGAVDLDDPTFKKANEACQGNLPGLFGGGG
jgi:hypothetical protein